MRFLFSFGIAVGCLFCAILVSIGVISNLWWFAAGTFTGWAILELANRL